jgi:SAM-dependent methyltransferase
MSPDIRAARGSPSYVWRAGQERRFQMMLNWVEPGGSRVLDAGCGVGMYLAAFLRHTPSVYGLEVEADRAREAAEHATGVALGVGESLPFSDGSFDIVFSHEVLEHVDDDQRCLAELVRVARYGGRILIFVPNRLYPFETHGFYWRGRYRFGNVPLVNYLPGALRDRLVPHVRAYTRRGLRSLLDGLPVRLVWHTQIFPGYDRLAARLPLAARALRGLTYALERTPLRVFGLSHFVVLERTPQATFPN